MFTAHEKLTLLMGPIEDLHSAYRRISINCFYAIEEQLISSLKDLGAATSVEACITFFKDSDDDMTAVLELRLCETDDLTEIDDLKDFLKLAYFEAGERLQETARSMAYHFSPTGFLKQEYRWNINDEQIR